MRSLIPVYALVFGVLAAAVPSVGQDAGVLIHPRDGGAGFRYAIRHASTISSAVVSTETDGMRRAETTGGAHTRNMTITAQLLLVPVPREREVARHAALLSFDTLEVLFDGMTEDGRMRAMRRSAEVPFTVALDRNGRIDQLAFSPVTDPAFRAFAKEFLAALVVPLPGRDSAWQVQQAWPDGEFIMQYVRHADAGTGWHTRWQQGVRRGLVEDSVFTDRQDIRLAHDDPFASELRMERGFVQRFQHTHTRVVKSMVATLLPITANTADSLAARHASIAVELVPEPMLRAFTTEERRIAVARTTLGKDNWQTLRARLFADTPHTDSSVALTAKFRALLQLSPVAGDSIRAAAALCDGDRLRVLFAAASETDTDAGDALLCDLLRQAAGGPGPIEDFFVTLALRPRVARCLPRLLFEVAHSDHPERSYQAGLLLSSLPRRLRATEAAGEVDSLLDQLLTGTESVHRRLVFTGNAGRCSDISLIERCVDDDQEELRAEAYHALRGMRCARADSLLARGFVNDASVVVRKRIAESLSARPAQSGLVDTLLHVLIEPSTEAALRVAVASLLLDWYSRLDARDREAIRHATRSVPDLRLRENMDTGLRSGSDAFGK